MVLGDTVSTLETFVWILNHVSKTITYKWSLSTLKASNLVKQLHTLNVIFHVVVSVNQFA